MRSTGTQTQLPIAPALRKYVAHYYHDSSDGTGPARRYTFYPHVHSAVSIYRGVDFQTPRADEHVFIPGDPSRISKFLVNSGRPRSVTQVGAFERIGIVFKPLGIHAFTDIRFDGARNCDVQPFLPVDAGVWADMARECFTSEVVEQRWQRLETFLLDRCTDRIPDWMYTAVRALSDPGTRPGLSSLCVSLGVSQHTLLRTFRRTTGRTPEEYRMLARFRNAVAARVVDGHAESLTELAYESGFVDQAYMIRCFRRFTGMTPKEFFRSGTRIGPSDAYWRMERFGSQ